MKKWLCLFLCLGLLLPLASAVADTGLTLNDLSDRVFYFSSGAGGWYTELYIMQGGSFMADYHDSEMGETGEGYPDGTVYGCLSEGAFGSPVEREDGNFILPILNLVKTEGQAPEEIEDGIRYVTVDKPYGLENATQLIVYCPGTDTADLPEAVLEWCDATVRESESLEGYILFNETDSCAFVEDTYVYDDQEILGECTVEPLPFAIDMDAMPIDGDYTCTISEGDVLPEGLVFAVQDYVRYDTAALQKLQPGETVLVCGCAIPVEDVAVDGGTIELNGGFFDADGYTFYSDDKNPEVSYLVFENDWLYTEVIGYMMLPYADSVHYSEYLMDEENNPIEGMYEEDVPGASFADYLNNRWQHGYFWDRDVTITIRDGMVAGIVVDYIP